MRGPFQFLKATIAGGFFVVLPIVLVAMILAETFDVLVGMATAVSEILVGGGLKGLPDPELVAVLVLIAVCFLTGLAMRTAVGLAVGRLIEKLILDPIPGYRVLRTFTRSVGGLDSSSAFTPAVMEGADGTRTPVLAVEENANGDVTVLIPMAPTPTVGPVHIVPGNRVRRIDVPLTQFMECYFHFGSGVGDLVAGDVVSSENPRQGG